MGERYEKIFELADCLSFFDCPLAIVAGALTKDNSKDAVLVQLRLRNLDKKIVKAASVTIVPKDIAGRVQGKEETHQYLDLNAKEGDDFGAKQAIYLSNHSTRSFDVRITEVVFEDQSVWTSNDLTYEKFPHEVEIADAFKNAELTKEFQTQVGAQFGTQCKFYPIKSKYIWRCTCGTLNKIGSASCTNCNARLDNLIALTDISSLRECINQRAEQDARSRAEMQRVVECNKSVEEIKAQEEKQVSAAKKPMKKTALFAILICLISVGFVAIQFASKKVSSKLPSEMSAATMESLWETPIATINESLSDDERIRFAQQYYDENDYSGALS